MELICNNDICRFNEHCRDCVYNGTLILNDDGECECFENYKDSGDYNNIYFVACAENGNMSAPYKRISKGRKTECNGFTLYYEAKDLTPGTWCTEEVSGVGASYSKFSNPLLAERFRQGIKRLSYKNVKDLPFKAQDTSKGGQDK